MANLVTYAKQKWEDAKTAITAARLNNMEQGINDCATQINALGDSVSQSVASVASSYGDVTFVKNGPVCYIKASISSENPFAVNKWVGICDVPSWVAVRPYWLTARSGSGASVGMWTVTDGKLMFYAHEQDVTRVIIEGLLLMR